MEKESGNVGTIITTTNEEVQNLYKGSQFVCGCTQSGSYKIFEIQSYEECRIGFCGISHVKWRKKVEMLVPLQLLMGKCRAYVKGVLLHRNSLKHSPHSNETISVTL